jgi:hypothetical protein
MEVFMVKNWKKLTRNRREWNKLVEKAKTHQHRVVVLQKKKKS